MQAEAHLETKLVYEMLDDPAIDFTLSDLDGQQVTLGLPVKARWWCWISGGCGVADAGPLCGACSSGFINLRGTAMSFSFP